MQSSTSTGLLRPGRNALGATLADGGRTTKPSFRDGR